MKTNPKEGSFFLKVMKYVLALSAAGILLFILSLAVKIWLVLAIYGKFVNFISTALGLDIVDAQLLSIICTAATVLVLPWIFSFIVLKRRKKELAVVGVLAYVVLAVSLHYGTANVFFDRTTGLPSKYYIKTLDGFEFSNSPDFSSHYGARFKPISPEIMRDYHYWEKYGHYKNVPQIEPGAYFDRLTGEVIVWYAIKNDEVVLSPLPGYDVSTGRRLLPITEEVARRYELQEQEKAARKLAEQRAIMEKQAAEKRAIWEKQAAEKEAKKEQEQARIRAAELKRAEDERLAFEKAVREKQAAEEQARREQEQARIRAAELKREEDRRAAAEKAAQQKREAEKKRKADIERMKRTGIVQFFDSVTGEPIVWYSHRGDCLVIFPRPGFDPVDGQMLHLITHELAILCGYLYKSRDDHGIAKYCESE